jgi:hypothetical protein
MDDLMGTAAGRKEMGNITKEFPEAKSALTSVLGGD